MNKLEPDDFDKKIKMMSKMFKKLARKVKRFNLMEGSSSHNLKTFSIYSFLPLELNSSYIRGVYLE
ncbi:MAG: hypothetical protein EU529_11485 [Promethearchaeota archaeon]|nr:MAG: hypothetical protein EU529_11485 [Candidatus Lokiarchaeota archaeon]